MLFRSGFSRGCDGGSSKSHIGFGGFGNAGLQKSSDSLIGVSFWITYIIGRVS